MASFFSAGREQLDRVRSVRPAARLCEGAYTSPVGYLEGIYVEPAFRRCGVAAELVRACEAWARARGCSEFASDTEAENVRSIHFHLSVGFQEANRVVCFLKRLDEKKNEVG